MKRKPVRKRPRAQGAGKKSAQAPSGAWLATPRRDPAEALLTAGAQALGFAIEPAWQPGIKFNLQLILRFAALVDEFPLPDDAEPAPVFRA